MPHPHRACLRHHAHDHLRRLIALLVLGGCGGPPGPGTGTPTGSDSLPLTGTTPTGSTPSLPTGRMETSGVLTCPSPAADAPGPYTATVHGAAWPKEADHGTAAWNLAFGGRGVVVADFTGDGALDLLVPRDEFEARFLRGDGLGGFTDDPTVFDGTPPMGHNGGSAADLDGDGDLDAFFYGLMGSATILWNEGGLLRAEPRPDWDTGDAPFGCGGAAAWADVDRDGDLDLFYGRLGGTDPFSGETHRCDSHLLLNDGTGALTISTAQLPAELQDIRVMAAGWYDFDGDGWLDLYAVSDAPPMRNLLLWNRAGALELSEPNGLQVITAGMGLGVGDLDEDGLPDPIVSGIRELPTMLSDPDLGVWIESSAAMGLIPDEASGRTIAWGGDLVDLDADSFLDAVFTYGGVFGTAQPKAQPDDLYRNRGDNTFEHVGDRWGWNQLDVGRGTIAADLDGDGWLDLAKRELGGGVTTSLARCGENGWLEVRLHDEDHPNHAAVGAKITVILGERRLVRWITAGSRSYCSGGPPVAHFGLGDANAIDGIEVQWPTGELVAYPATDARQRVDLWPN